jgi:phage gpG-like protein
MASFTIRYDKQILADMRRSLEGLRLGAYVPRLAQLVSVGAVKLTMDAFRNQRDPYGRAWQPLARERARDAVARRRLQAKGKKVRGQKILIDTGRMRNSTAPIFDGRSGGVAIPTGYAAVHQDGGRVMRGGQQVGVIPRRMMLPERQMGLPAHWQQMIQRETVGLLTRWVNKGARR